jgi:hypothetical protein
MGVLDRVLDEVGDDLFDREPVAQDFGHRFVENQVAPAFGQPHLHGVGNGMASVPSSIHWGRNVRWPSRDSSRIALMSRSILAEELRMKWIASGMSFFDHGAGRGTMLSALSVRALSSAARSTALAASSSEVKPRILTSGERKSWLTI